MPYRPTSLVATDSTASPPIVSGPSSQKRLRRALCTALAERAGRVSNGVALEVYRDAWAFRAARFAIPVEPSGQELDSRIFKYYGDQGEIERAYRN